MVAGNPIDRLEVAHSKTLKAGKIVRGSDDVFVLAFDWTVKSGAIFCGQSQSVSTRGC